MDRFYHLSETLEGDVLQPVWFRNPTEIEAEFWSRILSRIHARPLSVSLVFGLALPRIAPAYGSDPFLRSSGT